MTHQAVVTKNPFIPLASASQFLIDMEMSTGGPNIKRVVEKLLNGSLRWQSLSNAGTGSLQRVIMPLVRPPTFPTIFALEIRWSR